jgi:hypothetical protein
MSGKTVVQHGKINLGKPFKELVYGIHKYSKPDGMFLRKFASALLRQRFYPFKTLSISRRSICKTGAVPASLVVCLGPQRASAAVILDF